jgi:hypothetical protein
MLPGRPVQQIELPYWLARLGIDSWAPLKLYKYGLCILPRDVITTNLEKSIAVPSE